METQLELGGADTAGNGDSAKSRARKLAAVIARKCDGAINRVDRRLSSTLVRLIKSVGFRTHRRRLKFFEVAQAHGLHIQMNHFYSPVPDTSCLDPDIWKRRADQDGDIDLRVDAQLALLRELSRFAHEIEDIPLQSNDPATYCWENPVFWPGDGAAYYCMIRHLGSKQILEVGSGHSTRLAARAARLNGADLTCIEPYPMASLTPDILPGLSRLIESPAQDVPLEEFERLRENDILFIDSTHVSKIGSDVNYLFLRVLPRLKPGVVIHVHDIFLPWEMPRRWVLEENIFWNEQYLLQAFLSCNSSFEILMGNQYLGRAHAETFRAAFPCIPKRFAPGGVSFWMRRVTG